ncbi:MAG: acyl-CoA thioesterase [Elusimicrobia bacterium]|nr:acyl-CoA thioesterase [Elusimicrobiota bacterium]
MPPPGYKVSVDVQVRFRDTDAMGHVNNAVYLSYLELARLHYWRTVTGSRDIKAIDIIVARVEIDYRAAVMLDTELACWVRVSEWGRSSFTMEYRLEEKGAGRLMAQAKTVQACFDYAAGKVKRVPEEFRRKAEALEAAV